MKLSHLAFASAFLITGSAFAGPLAVKLEPAQAKASNAAVVKFTITNNSKKPTSVLRWETPLTGVLGEIFHVSVDGVEAEYYGRHYKWATPAEHDFIWLGAGESESIEVDLSAYYNMSKSGTYEIAYNNTHGREYDDAAMAKALTSPSVRMFVEGVPYNPPATPIAWASQKANAAGFTACSSSQQTAINTGMNNAGSYAANSLSYLNSGAAGARYTTWFGTYDATRYNTVKTHFVKIDEALRTKPVTFDCACTDSAYAWVYSNQPYNIHVCNAFWSAPATGTDSKAGTIVHEISHFTVVAGTSDYAYGHTAAKSLAKKRPSRAINNADSHEYFAENTPALN